MAKIPKSLSFLDLMAEVCQERGWDPLQASVSLARSSLAVPGSRDWEVPGDKAGEVKRELHRILDELDKTPKSAIQAELDAYNSRN